MDELALDHSFWQAVSSEPILPLRAPMTKTVRMSLSRCVGMKSAQV